VANTYPKADMKMTVTWGDSDPAGISYYARTFDWFTNARMHFFAEYGFTYMETFHGKGIALVCLHADCDYKKMVRPGEPITVRASLTNFSRTRLAISYQVFNKNGELAEIGETVHAYTDNDGKPFNLKRRHPQLWNELIEKWPIFNQ